MTTDTDPIECTLTDCAWNASRKAEHRHPRRHTFVAEDCVSRSMCMDYLRKQAEIRRAQEAQRDALASRLDTTRERLDALLAASVHRPGIRWSL